MTDIETLKTLSQGEVVRSLLTFLAYAEPPYFSEAPYLKFGKQVRKAFKKYIKNRNTYKTIVFLRSLIPSHFVPPNLAYWKKDRKRFLGAVLLLTVVPWYKSKDHDHSKIILSALDAIIDGKKIPEKMIDNIGITYSNQEETSQYVTILHVVSKFNDLLFQVLPVSNIEEFLKEINNTDVNSKELTLVNK